MYLLFLLQSGFTYTQRNCAKNGWGRSCGRPNVGAAECNGWWRTSKSRSKCIFIFYNFPH